MSSECLVVPASCCGTCGAATRGDAIAIHVNQLAGKASCDGCPGCDMEQDPTLVATCDNGACTLVDLLEHESTACTDASECRVRSHDCGGCGVNIDSGAIIAVSNDMLYELLVCDGGEMRCSFRPDNLPYEAHCEAEHCIAVQQP